LPAFFEIGNMLFPLFGRTVATWVAGLLLAAGSASADAGACGRVDAHVHFVDFFQDSEGTGTLLKAMDAAHIDRVVLMGMPITKKWDEHSPQRPRYFQGDDSALYWFSATDVFVAAAVQRLPEADRDRIIPFLSGFNPNDRHAADHIERMIALYPGLWQGIGEVMTRHDSLTALVQDETPRANNAAMMGVYRVAARYGLPVLLHSNITSIREDEPLYLPELEEALEQNPDTRFIWAHAGTSAEIERHLGRLEFLPGVIESLLSRYPNLFIDLSWRVLQPYLLEDDGTPRGQWLSLITRHPTRFVIGSDVVGRFARLGEKLEGFDAFLKALPDEAAQGLAGANLCRLVPVNGVTITAYEGDETLTEELVRQSSPLSSP
jgi:hypothetical protein